MINKKVDADIVALCETKRGENDIGHLEETMNKKQYKIYPSSTKVGKEGIALAVKHNAFKYTLDVTTTQLNTIMSIRMFTGAYCIRVILGYAPQETDSEACREQFFDELELEIKMCVEAGDIPFLLGDFNAKITKSDTPQGLPVSRNGILFHEILQEYNLHVLNFDESICTGIWTHVIRTSNASSVLDYVATNSTFKQKVKEMVIDESTVLCPFRVVQVQGTKTATLSDHNAIIVTMEIPRVKVARKKEEGGNWIFDPEGFSMMSSLFDEKCAHINTDQETQPLYDDMESLIDETLNQCFKRSLKRKPNNSFAAGVHHTHKNVCKKLTEFAARGKTQREVAKQYREKILQMNTETISEINNKKLLKRVENLSENDKFSAQKFWKEKKAISGTQRTCHSVYDLNGLEVFDTEEIIAAYQDEFDKRLSGAEIKTSLKNYKGLTDDLCSEIIKVTRAKKVSDFTFDELDKIMSSLKKGKSSGPDKKPAEVYINCGNQLKTLILHVINKVKNTHLTPKQWEMMMITPIYKGKGSRKDLLNQRGIFLTQVICKIWERMIKGRTKNTTSKINKLQAGSKTGKCPGDQVFLLRSCITHAKYLHQALYLNFYDFRQCFDKLWLEDSIVSLYKLGLDNELLASIYETNYAATITVNTPLGKSGSFSKIGIVKQGSVMACCMCCASTGEFCDEYYEGGMPIGKTVVNVLAYVDDLVVVNNNVVDAKNGHDRVCFFADRKKQPLNEEKCLLLPVNCKRTDPIPTQHVNGKQVILVEKTKYLGDVFNSRGDYRDLIDDRTRKATVCTVNSIALCNDSQMGKYALFALLLLYVVVFLPTVLYNSKTWNNLTKNDISKLTSAQNKYLKWMLHTPRGTCTSFTLLELGLLPIEDEISLQKLGFLHHILTLPSDDPVRIVYEEQKLYTSEPNWYNEICLLLEKYGLEMNENLIGGMSKERWKETTKSAIRKTVFESLYADCVTKSKTSKLPKYPSFSQQEYFQKLSPKRARIYFQLRAGVYDVKVNRKYMYNDDICRLCGNGQESIDHIINHCTQIKRATGPLDCIYSTSDSETLELLNRVEQFQVLIEKKSKEPTRHVVDDA